MRQAAYIALQIGLFITTILFFQDKARCKIFAPGKCIDTVAPVLHHAFYTIYFDSTERGPDYSDYWLTRAKLKHVVARPASFHTDPLLFKNQQGSNSIYRNSGYDKGHLSPADDFRFNAKAEKESMYMTNVAPQNPYFNEHLWKAVEDHVRDLAQQYDSVYVVTGVVYGSKKLHGIGIPDYYWKMIQYGNHIEYYLGKNERPKSNDINSIRVDRDTFLKITLYETSINSSANN
jgi:DNA/RNA endonuclease G (NUC1)